MALKFNNTLIRDKRELLRIFPIDIANELNIGLTEYRNIEDGLIIPDEKLITQICNRLDLNIDEVYQKNIKETKVLSIFNSKGGIGKSTTCNSLASVFSKKGFKVLCIDLDAQCNLTNSFGIIKDNYSSKNIFDLFSTYGQEEINLSDFIMKTKFENIDILPGREGMDEIIKSIKVDLRAEFILYDVLKPLIDNVVYDFIIIDNSASAQISLFNSFYVCNYAIAPLVASEKFALDGLNGLFDTVNRCLVNNTTLKDLKIFINKYDRRAKEIEEIKNAVNNLYPDTLMKTVIRIDRQLEYAQKASMPICDFNPKCKAVEDFSDLADEIIELI